MLILAYDNLDKTLGDYFTDCANEIRDSVNESLSQSIIEIFGEQLNIININHQLSLINDSGFIFCAFSHGTIKSLNAKKLPYIECGLNTSSLKGGLTYTNACLAGDTLGKEIISKGAKAFIGYKGEVNGIVHKDFRKISIRCDNYALILFLNKYTLQESVEKAKDYFSSQIDLLYESSPLVAALLLANRDSLITHGELNFTLESLIDNS